MIATQACLHPEVLLLAPMTVLIVGRVLYLLVLGSRKNAICPWRYIGFAVGYSALGATAAGVLIDALAGERVPGSAYCFMLASCLLIIFRGGDHQKDVADRVAECFRSARKT